MLPAVIYVLGKLDHGGGEIRSLQLIREVKRRHPGLRVIVFSACTEKGSLEGDFEEAGASILHGRRLRSGGALDFWRACRRQRAGVVHLNLGMISGYYAAIAWLAGVDRRICHFRTTDHRCTRLHASMLFRLGRALIRLFATHCIGVCAAARHSARIPERRWLTVHNGVEADDPETALRKRREAARDGSSNVVVLGRISPEKNYLRPVAIVEAMARHRDSGPVRLHFVGPGRPEHLARLHSRIGFSPDPGAIAVHGLSTEPLDHLRRSDVLLLTSLREGLPGAVLEALSVGTPVVAADLPGTREIAAAVEGVTLVPLAASDGRWCEAIAAALRAQKAEAIIRSFASGPFRFGPHVDRMASLWGLPNASAAPARLRPPAAGPAAPAAWPALPQEA